MIFSKICNTGLTPLTSDARGSDIIEYFGANPSAPLCVLIDRKRRPAAVIGRHALMQRMATMASGSLNEASAKDDLAEDEFMTVRLTEKIDGVISKVFNGNAELLSTGLVVVDDEGMYAGVAGAFDILQVLYSTNTKLVKSLRKEIVERKQAERNARLLANSDPLTALANRRAFLNHVADAIDEGEPFLCGFIDLDGFKQLNDEFGHSVGDAVLVSVGDRLLGCTGLEASARLGGDEFAFMIPKDADKRGDGPRIDGIHDIITQPAPSEVGPVAVGASIGVARFPEDAKDRSTLLHAADRSMLRAKAAGGGAEWFDPRHDANEAEHSAMETAFRQALSQREISPFFQPILDMSSNEIVGHEVLARWPRSGFQPAPGPAVFLPIAERLGLIGELFWTVTEKAFQTYTEQGGSGAIAVNVSPPQIKSHEFASRLLWMLEHHKIAPGDLELEITESAMFRNRVNSLKLLHELHEAGLSIVLDDFGTGYSSLSLVQDLPLTKLKIDRSFVCQLDRPGPGESIISATLSLCRELGITSCAEGVETKTQLKRLRELGCDFAQGYYIGRPTSALQHAAHNELDGTPADWRTKAG